MNTIVLDDDAKLAKHALCFLTFTLHQSNWAEDIYFVGFHDMTVLYHFIHQKMNFFQLVHDVEFTNTSRPFILNTDLTKS